jgi:hypothetical protein
MTTPDEPIEDEPSDLRDSKDDDAMRALLKRSLGDGDKAAPPAELLRGVQRRIRTRSRGRFFADGWSTTDSRVNYALVATVMLVVIALAYFALGPLGVSK